MQPPVGDAEGWVEYRIFLSQFTETTPRSKELEVLSWIPVLEKCIFQPLASRLRFDREASALIGGHHWHREGFRLRLVTNEKAATIHANDGMLDT